MRLLPISPSMDNRTQVWYNGLMENNYTPDTKAQFESAHHQAAKDIHAVNEHGAAVIRSARSGGGNLFGLPNELKNLSARVERIEKLMQLPSLE
jgi:hypothetical protein